MKIAQAIKRLTVNAESASEKARKVSSAVGQDWKTHATVYTFADESVLVVNGPCVSAYDNLGEISERTQSLRSQASSGREKV